MPTTKDNHAAAAPTAVSKRRRRGNFMQQFSCLWNPAVVPHDDDENDWKHYNPRNGFQPQRSASTFIGEDDDDDDLEDDTLDEETATNTPVLPAADATPAVWLEYYLQLLPLATDWTERANLYYTVAHLHVQCHDYEAATRAFEKEAAVLQGAGVTHGEALVAIYQSCAKLWLVRHPTRALHYYDVCLQHCATQEQRTAIRHAMGRLYFQTGNLERAMQVVSIGGGSSNSNTAATKSTTTTTTRTTKRHSL